MVIKIISFGKIADFIPGQQMVVAGVRNTDELKKHLEASFPMLRQVKYKLCLNKNIVQENTTISNQDTVAIMPPFSGG